MRRTIAWGVGPAFALVALLGVPCGADEQMTLGGMSVEGALEAGVRFFVDEPPHSSKAKLEEYREFLEGLHLENLELRFFRPDESYAVEFGGARWGHEDQAFTLRSGRLGLWEFQFGWDQTPHVFSTNARMLATETSRGVFRLPAGLTRTLPTDGPLYNAAPELDEVSVRWDTARMSLRLTPMPELDLQVSYRRIRKEGDRPFGVPFLIGPAFIEVLEPIEQTIHDVRLRGAVARESWQVQFGYTLSVFENDLTSVTADNPLQAADGPPGGFSIPGSGRVSLAPDNMAHTFSLAGGANLPMRTRVNASASYSLQLQNDAFLPHTRNPNIVGPGLELPQRSLNGSVHTVLVNLHATNRPLRPLTLSAKYRFYARVDASDTLTFPAQVFNDTFLSTTAQRASRPDYHRHNVDLDARWRLAGPLTLTLGAGWERWDRDESREVQESDELFGKVALDIRPANWLLARLTYRPSARRIAGYDTISQSESTLLRKFDEGERNRHPVDGLIQLMPHESLTATLSGGWREDDYVASVLGLQNETGWSAGVDLTWTPVERLSVSAGYMHESISAQMRSRYRLNAEFADFDWVSHNVDIVDTFHASMTAFLIPRRLELNLGGNYSTALGRVTTSNPVQPVSGGAAAATATAQPWPAFEDELLRLEVALRFHFLKNWTASLRYLFESFDQHDWRTDQLDPFVPGQTSIWLGDDPKGYTAHILGATLGYRFR